MNVEEVAGLELDGLDPYDLMDAEAARIDGFLAGLDTDSWRAPTACGDWDRTALAAHLAGSEEYNHACLDGDIDGLMSRAVAAGVTDVHSFNAWTVTARADRTPAQLLEEWRRTNGRTRVDLRSRDGADIPTLAGAYPTRWQAFHLAAELATHADDLGVPVTDEERPDRDRWRARVARFMVAETQPDLSMTVSGSTTTVEVDGVSADLDDATLVAAVAARLAEDSPVSPGIRSRLSAMP